MPDNQESSKALEPQYEVYNDVYLYKGDELICSKIFNIQELKKMVELANNAEQLTAIQQALDRAVEALEWINGCAISLPIQERIKAALASIKEKL